MGQHSVADAKNRLSELIDLALEGKDVVITRHGRPVVELKAIQRPPRPVTREDIEWLEKHRVRPRRPVLDSATLVSQMRDEDEK
jgi:antitoxin (DNA-binding transcriptional repressor) of toxin-antitoxin stability system